MDVYVDERLFSRLSQKRREHTREAVKRLRERPMLGKRIKRRQIPRRFKELPNLFRLTLPDGWRLLYTLASHPGFGAEIHIMWVGDHTSYDRLFGYG